jgi:hypothetical protein
MQVAIYPSVSQVNQTALGSMWYRKSSSDGLEGCKVLVNEVRHLTLSLHEFLHTDNFTFSLLCA